VSRRLNREGNILPTELVISRMEMKVLDYLKPDPPPGNTVIWRGMQRLTEIQIGVGIGMKLVGN
jgi:hypothetical protein